MNRRVWSSAAAAATVAVATFAASGDVTLSEWTFEVSVPTTSGPHMAEGGLFAATSFANGFHADPGAVYSNPVGNGSFESFSSNFWFAGDYYEFQTSTVGYQDISLFWDQTRSSTGASVFDLAWSTDGIIYTTFLDDYTIEPISWSSGTFHPETRYGTYAMPVELADQANVYFRMTAQLDASSTGGSNRIDNITVGGTLIPAPGSIALLGLGGLLLTRRRRA